MKTEQSSFRDRDGFIFYQDDEVYRAILPSYYEDYSLLKDSGLLHELTDKHLLVGHEECENFTDLGDIKLIKPQKIPFISYPYEWSFHQLKRAALLTLDIQLASLQRGMSLKDATAFNVQFLNGKPIFIDTLSFERYKEGEPWQAYKQFCQHFLAPLVMQVYGVDELNKIQQVYIDGLPLDLAVKALPFRSRLNLSIYPHIHLNAKYERKYKGDTKIKDKKIALSKEKLVQIINHLKVMVSSFKLPKSKTNWTDYYQEFSYNDSNIQEKKDFVREIAEALKPAAIVDSGSNTGVFSEICSPYAQQVISFDFDASVIHNQCKNIAKKKLTNILPLIVDMINPTPAIGWGNEERKSFVERLPQDAVTLSLALIHHLVLSNNLTFEKIAEFYARFSKNLVIEFVPKDDIQSQRLLVTKRDIFADYTLEHFQSVFEKYYKLIRKKELSGSKRILYHFERL
ncbi:MAG: hypothetical protein K0R65_52 [Crocinitomicaceae bacterium]|nr:hypothetical protein [Crocinitomicaceae bacterium]